MPRPRTVYRGKRKYSWLITLLAMILVVLIALAVWLFYYLQRYIVYDKDGLRLDLSARREELLRPGTDETPQPVAVPHVDVEIVVEQRDYSEIETDAGNNLAALHAVFVPAKDVTENTLKFYAGRMGDFNALVLELKDAEGFLRWHSGVPTADSFAVNGDLELRELLAPLKEQGVWLVAQISTLNDTAMAQRNAPIALKTAVTGQPFADAAGGWLDPYSDSTREYLLSLILELKDLGFDEVLLTGVACPDSDALAFSKTMTQTPDSVTAVSSFALWLRERAEALGFRVSAVIDHDALVSETGSAKGQNPVLFFKAFDRVAVETNFDTFTADIAALETALGGHSDTRIVAVTADYTPETASYIVK